MEHVSTFLNTARRGPAGWVISAASVVIVALIPITACIGRDVVPTSTHAPTLTRPSAAAPADASVTQRTGAPGPYVGTQASTETLLTPTAITTASASEPDAVAAPAVVVEGSRSSVPVTLVHSTQTRWVTDRVAAVEKLWGFTDAGEKWMEGYDLRQMVGQPSWYGSHGHGSWAGVGQAVPRLILHELSHSYWDAFDVPGLPGISRDAHDGRTSPRISNFRRALETFMAQPADRFEPLRDRFRNLPNLAAGEYPDLFHFGEADLIYMTGGDLDLVPPVLLKYFSGFLNPIGAGGVDFGTWSDALRWFMGMSESDRRAAGEVFGLQHLPLAKYESFTPVESTVLPAILVDTLNAEAEQRLRDFAEQFAEVKEKEFGMVDAAGVDRGFQFWRDYIREMSSLHNRHIGVLRESGSPLGAKLADALDFYRAIRSRDTSEQAVLARKRFDEHFVFRDLAVLLDARALVEVFAKTGSGSSDGLGTVFAGYATQLAQLVRAADNVIESGKRDPAEGAQAFDAFVATLDNDRLRASINVVVDMMRESDPETTRASLQRIGNGTLLRLLAVRPELARSNEVTPERLLEALGITSEADIDTLIIGVRRLLGNTSGNFEIDRAADAAMYKVLHIREIAEHGSTLTVLDGASVRLDLWLEANPVAALTALEWDIPRSAQFIVSAADVRASAPSILHRIVPIDPLLAANLLLEMESTGMTNIVPDTLNHFAYNAYWAHLGAVWSVDTTSLAVFLTHLSRSRGNDWLGEQFLLGAKEYGAAIAAGDLEEDYPQRHADTLEAISLAPLSVSIRGVLMDVATSLHHP